jgi:hypothetical protein
MLDRMQATTYTLYRAAGHKCPRPRKSCAPKHRRESCFKQSGVFDAEKQPSLNNIG